MIAPKVHSEVLTVMIIDLVGYTKTTSQLKREGIDRLHETFDSISLPLFDKYDGKVVKKIGDAFLVTFKSPTNAVLCGIALQNEFRYYNLKLKPAIPLKIRVALHSGEVVLRVNDVYGDAVNTAARIEGFTKAEDIVFSETVYHAMNKNEIPYMFIGEKRFKGVKRPVKLFRVKKKYDTMRQINGRALHTIKRKSVNFLLFLLILGLIVLVLYGAWYYLL